MESGKLIRILRNFSYKERKKFGQYAASALFNENPRLVKMLEVIEDSIFHLKINLPSKEKMWSELFPEKKHYDAHLRKEMSDLTRLAEDFLVLQRIEKKTSQKNLLLLEELNERQMDKDFEQHAKKMDALQTVPQVQDAEFFQHQYHYALQSKNFMGRIKERTQEPNLQRVAQSLDYYYLINKLKCSCEMFNYKNVTKVDYEFLLLEEILQHIRQQNYEDVPAIAIYYNILMMLKEEQSEPFYKELKRLLEKYSSKFKVDEVRDMYTYCLNYCIKKFNSGETKYQKELFHLYKQALERGILFEKKYLSPWNYKNIVSIGLKVNEDKWVEQFIHQYKDRMEAKYRGNAFTYNLARLHFNQKKYDEVIRLLQKVEYEDVFYNLDSKLMLLKTYYENGETIALLSLLDTFALYIRRNKAVSEYHRVNYLNLIKFVKKLMKIQKGEKKKIEQLKNELQNTKLIPDINWLKEKMEEMVA